MVNEKLESGTCHLFDIRLVIQCCVGCRLCSSVVTAVHFAYFRKTKLGVVKFYDIWVLLSF